MTPYGKLDKDRHDIRVLYLQHERVSRARGLDCLLRVLPRHDLDNSRGYQVLSYVWGSERETKEIILNGFAVKICSNLFEALCQIWTRDPLLAIWADAICINQDDLEEKADQVQIMSSIYAHGQAVMVWLGEAEASTGQAWELLASSNIHVAEPGVSERELDSAPALIDLGTRPWWLRCWTFQELVLAPRAYVLCGTHILGWEKFENNLLRLATRLSRRVDCCDVLSNLRLLQHSERLIEGNRIDFTDLVIDSRLRQASDPRDKIYALLGFQHSEGIAPIITNYTDPIFMAYARATARCIESSRSLRILRGAGLRFLPDTVDELCNGEPVAGTSVTGNRKWPSWVVNFNNPIATSLLERDPDFNVFESVLDPSRTFRPVISIFEDKLTVKLEGIALGLLSQAVRSQRASNVTSLPDCLRHMSKEPNQKNVRKPIKSYVKRFLHPAKGKEKRTFMTNAENDAVLRRLDMHSVMQALSIHNAQQCSCLKIAKRTTEPWAVTLDYLAALDNLAGHAELDHLREHDLICLLDGSHDFFVLRAVAPQSSRSPQRDGPTVEFNLVATLRPHHLLFQQQLENFDRFEASFVLV